MIAWKTASSIFSLAPQGRLCSPFLSFTEAGVNGGYSGGSTAMLFPNETNGKKLLWTEQELHLEQLSLLHMTKTEDNKMRPFKLLDRWAKKTDDDLRRVKEEQKEMRARLAVLEKQRQVLRREYNG